MSDDVAIREIARQITQLRREMRAVARAAQGPRRSVDVGGGGTAYYAEDGTPLLAVGVGEDGEFGFVNVDPSTPPIPTQPDVVPVVSGINIIWDGTFEDSNWTTNMSHVEVHVSDTPDFVADDTTQVSVFTSDKGGQFAYSTPSDTTTKYVALVSVSLSGVESPKSVEASGAGLVVDASVAAAIEALETATEDNADAIIVAQNTANGKNHVTYSNADPVGAGTAVGDIWFKFSGGNVIGHWYWDGGAWVSQPFDNAVIANLDAAKITTGFLDAARIQASSITADKIAADAVTASKIAAGAIDGKTITGAFIRTAASGQRWEIQSSPANEIYGYTGAADELSPGKLSIDDTFGYPRLALVGPRSTAATSLAAQLKLDSDNLAGKNAAQLLADWIRVAASGYTVDIDSTGVLIGDGTQRIRTLDFASPTVTVGTGGEVNVTHGLGATPSFVNVQARSVNQRTVSVIAKTSTNFRIKVWIGDGSTLASGDTIPIDWLAIR